jgi:hypothetical protein
MFLVLIFTRGWVDPRAMVQSGGVMSLKNPVTSPRIDPGTVRLVAQCLKRYATPGPHHQGTNCVEFPSNQRRRRQAGRNEFRAPAILGHFQKFCTIETLMMGLVSRCRIPLLTNRDCRQQCSVLCIKFFANSLRCYRLLFYKIRPSTLISR